MRTEMKRLIELDREVYLLAHISAILSWDQETYMPPKAVEERSEQLAFMATLAHDKAVQPEIGELLGKLGSSSAQSMGDASLPGVERAYLRALRRGYDRETKIPADLVTEFARETSLAQAAWAEARGKNDFPAFAPHLERIVELQKRRAAFLDPGKKAYDVFLDMYEPGNTEASVAAVFGRLRTDLVALLGRIRTRPQVDDSFLRRNCPVPRQAAISDWLMDLMAYDRERGRLDTVPHPFTTTLGADDVRITTRYLPDYFSSSLYSTAHEAGHALYELGIAPGEGFARTSLADAASMAIHESQSRMWENMVCRSSSFWKRNYPKLAELAGPALEGVSLEAFSRAVNKVETSLIRTEADEVTYGLHIILRFELESELLSGRLAVKDLPAAWNGKMRDFLGMTPPDGARGCLQDVHWSIGLFGYFPSYALGNLYAAQFWDAMTKKMGDLDARIEAGDLGSILGWLRENVHRGGSTWLPEELAERVTGSRLDPGHFTRYLERKYSRVYGL